MDKILLKGLSFQARHGYFPEEKKYAQNFTIDVTILTDLDKAGKSDNLEDTINYGTLYEIIHQEVTENTYQLIETLAAKIAFLLLSYNNAIAEVIVTVHKPNPPVEGVYDYFGVEIRRDRSWLASF